MKINTLCCVFTFRCRSKITPILVIPVCLLVILLLIFNLYVASKAQSMSNALTIDDDAHFTVSQRNRPHVQQRVLLAIDNIASKSKLVDMQKKFLLDQERPPDSVYNVNVTASDLLSLDRTINDTRPQVCRKLHYDIDKLPKASVVIPFFNEALSVLLRTIHSILNRTPDKLLEEIILIDDSSTYKYLSDHLPRYINFLPKIKLFRNRRREGLIRSRLYGADQTTAPVVVFLDAHTECNEKWLEPLLAEIKKNPTTVVQPFVDGIDSQTFVYSKPAEIHRGAFTWDLRYVWLKVPDHMQKAALEEGRPYWSSTLVGCAMAINRSYFYTIGAFDPDQLVWGGENIELSFRSWMCNGSVITLPCSRVGHIFREIPYIKDKHNDDIQWQVTWQKNLMRVAETWMDDYKKYFYYSTRVYDAKRVSFSENERESLKKRFALRDQLHCKSFDWYLENVIPEIPIPDTDALYHGEIGNYRTGACWEVLGDGYISMTYACYEHKIIPQNIFTLKKNGLLQYKNKCVRFMFPKPFLKIDSCPESPSLEYGTWELNFEDKRWAQIQIKLKVNKEIKVWCIHQVTNAVLPHKRMQMPQINICDRDSEFQFWSFSYRFDFRE